MESVRNGLGSGHRTEENVCSAKDSRCFLTNGTLNEEKGIRNGKTHQLYNRTNGFHSNASPQSGVVEVDTLTAEVLRDLFDDKTCVLRVRHYTPALVCDILDRFLLEQGSEPYTHEIRSGEALDLVYFGVNRYGFPLNSTYSGDHLDRYMSEALPTLRSLRRACRPYLSPIDKFRVEMDETWRRNVNVATFAGRKTFCGIGRVMLPDLSELSEVQPHFDAVPTSYFPRMRKQFTANFYLQVPESGGELEIWDDPPVSVEENFEIPEDWRAVLPASMKVKPEKGDLLMFNTRRPHAITKFGGPHPRTSIQTFVGLAENSEVFLWV